MTTITTIKKEIEENKNDRFRGYMNDRNTAMYSDASIKGTKKICRPIPSNMHEGLTAMISINAYDFKTLLDFMATTSDGIFTLETYNGGDEAKIINNSPLLKNSLVYQIYGASETSGLDNNTTKVQCDYDLTLIQPFLKKFKKSDLKIMTLYLYYGQHWPLLIVNSLNVNEHMIVAPRIE